MPSPARHAAALLLALSLGACAAAAGTPGSSRPNPNVISRAEIEREGPSSVFDLIQKLRPLWLSARASSFTQDTSVVVYLDGTRMGGPEALREVSTPNVEKVEFLDAGRATARFGVGHVNGAILITTRG
jgi:hypothetical protein